MRFRNILALLLPMLLLTFAPPAASGHYDYPDELAATWADGQGWAAYRVETDGPFWASVQACNWQWAHRAELHVYDEHDRLVHTGGGVTNEHRGGAWVTVDAGAAHERVDVLPGPDPQSDARCNSVGGSLVRVNPGVYTVVLIAAGDITGWWHTLRGDGGTRILNATSGDDAFLLTPRDFGGLVNAQAWHTMPGVGVDAAIAGEATLTIDHRLVGHFRPWNLADDVLFSDTSVPTTYVATVDGPDGLTVCPCNFHRDQRAAPGDVTDADVWGPGTYTFRVTGASATTDVDDLRLFGADVAFPR